MEFLAKIKTQLEKMSEAEKNEWILCQAKLLSESRQEDILLSLSGEKKIIDMPSQEDIDKFCEQVKCGEIYVEYEAHYCEFDSDGRYLDDWEYSYDDPLGAIEFLDGVFEGCHQLLRLEEYQTVTDILGRVCELRFPVREAEDSEDLPEEDFLSLSAADEEDMFYGKLSDVGEDWIRAVIKLTQELNDGERAKKLIKLLEHPVCKKVQGRILVEEGISPAVLREMAAILEKEIAELEAIKKNFREDVDFRKTYELRSAMDRRKELLADIRDRCLKIVSTETQQKVSKLAASWNQIKERIKWLSYEPYIDDQPSIDEIQDICEALIRRGQLEQEDWKVRKTVLRDIIQNEYYDYYNCGDVMAELAGKLCTNKEEYLACADIMDTMDEYKEKAAYLYYQYGRDDKYVSYLETHLDRRSKEYSALITYYLEHDQKDNARRVAELGLERCKEDTTDIFICLLLGAQEDGDQKRFQALYSRAKKRKKVDLDRVDSALR